MSAADLLTQVQRLWRQARSRGKHPKVRHAGARGALDALELLERRLIIITQEESTLIPEPSHFYPKGRLFITRPVQSPARSEISEPVTVTIEISIFVCEGWSGSPAESVL